MAVPAIGAAYAAVSPWLAFVTAGALAGLGWLIRSIFAEAAELLRLVLWLVAVWAAWDSGALAAVVGGLT